MESRACQSRNKKVTVSKHDNRSIPHAGCGGRCGWDKMGDLGCRLEVVMGKACEHVDTHAPRVLILSFGVGMSERRGTRSQY